MTNPTELLAYYRNPEKNPVQMARMFKAALEHYETQIALSEASGIHNSVVNNYLSLFNLPGDVLDSLSAGKLKFREARDLSRLKAPPERITDLAQAFTGRKITARQCSRYIQLAKNYPQTPVSELVAMARNEAELPLSSTAAGSGEVDTTPKIERRPMPVPAEIGKMALELMAALWICKWDDTPDALMARSALKRLLPEIEQVVGKKVMV